MIEPIRNGALQVGLTDDPETVLRDLGNPAGWQLFGPFHSEAAALRWKEILAALPGCAAAPPCAGWRFGFFYAAARPEGSNRRMGDGANTGGGGAPRRP